MAIGRPFVFISKNGKMEDLIWAKTKKEAIKRHNLRLVRKVV
jgi:hypothetical protein